MKILFGTFTLDLDTRQLLNGREEIHISPKAFDLLAILANARPNVVSKQALQKQLWPDTYVAEANLSNLIAEIRNAIDDSAREPRFIRTAHRYGYAFCGEAATSGIGPRATPTPSCWVNWGMQRFPLPPGEHIIGRGAEASIRLDGNTVSRRHARIVVKPDVVVLEDFGSKNGTYRGKVRVTEPVTRADGDEIRIGSQLIQFHQNDPDSTETVETNV